MRIPVTFARGGTSKAAVLLESELPPAGAERDALLLRLMGGGDPFGRQLDGLGGGTSSTSKVAIVSPGRDGADVTFLFAQVGTTAATVDYSGTCGNISAAIAPYAIDHGMVEATDPRTTVRVRNLNTGTDFVATVATERGRFQPEGDHAIAGVAGTGSPVMLDYLDPAGAVTGSLYPTGAATDTIDGVRVSVLDVANPVVFIAADALGVALGDGPVPEDRALLTRIETIRRRASVLAGIAPDEEAAAGIVVPRVALVGADPQATIRGAMISAGRPHPAFPFTGALATAAAARLPGTVVHDLAAPGDAVVVRHPAGDIDLDVELDGDRIVRVGSSRTARILMTGWADVPVTPAQQQPATTGGQE